MIFSLVFMLFVGLVIGFSLGYIYNSNDDLRMP